MADSWRKARTCGSVPSSFTRSRCPMAGSDPLRRASSCATVAFAAVMAVSLAALTASEKKPRRVVPNRPDASSSTMSSGNPVMRLTSIGQACAASSPFAYATTSSMRAEQSRCLQLVQSPSTSRISAAPFEASVSSSASSACGRQGTSTYFAGSARRLAEMRAHARTARPPLADIEASAAADRPSPDGSSMASASVGQAGAQAPHAMQAPASRRRSFPPASKAPAGQAATHRRHVALRLRTATQRSGETSTGLFRSASATLAMSLTLGMAPV